MIALQMADLCAYEARYKTITFMGQAEERPEFTRMDAKDAWYSFAIFREKELLQNLETARIAGLRVSHLELTKILCVPSSAVAQVPIAFNNSNLGAPEPVLSESKACPEPAEGYPSLLRTGEE